MPGAAAAGEKNEVLPARWPPYDPGMDLRIATIAERPAMKSRFVNKETEPWPAFMNEDPIARLYFSDVRIAHPEYGLIAYDAGTPDQAVARAFCVPFAWDGDPALGELPVDGWDGVIWRSARDRQIGQKPNLVSALEITVPADLQGTGLSGKMLAAMRDNAARLGFEHLVAPVRPNRKHLVPDMPIEAYAALVREDGLPQDELRAVLADGAVPGEPPLADGTVALFNRGTPSGVVTPDGTLWMTLLRACCSWPSGVWIDGDRRTAPDGSSFAWQHWTHTFSYALAASADGWREAGFNARAEDYNHDLTAVVTGEAAEGGDGDGGDGDGAAALTLSVPNVTLCALKPHGPSPRRRGGPARLPAGRAVTVRLRETEGMTSPCHSAKRVSMSCAATVS